MEKIAVIPTLILAKTVVEMAKAGV